MTGKRKRPGKKKTVEIAGFVKLPKDLKKSGITYPIRPERIILCVSRLEETPEGTYPMQKEILLTGSELPCKPK